MTTSAFNAAAQGQQVPAVLASLSCRCDGQTAEALKTAFGHCDGADHICTLELETHVTRLGEQLQTLGCSGKTLGTPEKEVSRALRSQILQLEGLAAL